MSSSRTAGPSGLETIVSDRPPLFRQCFGLTLCSRSAYWEAEDLHYWSTNNLEWYAPRRYVVVRRLASVPPSSY